MIDLHLPSTLSSPALEIPPAPQLVLPGSLAARSVLNRVGWDDVPWPFNQRWETRRDNPGKRTRHGPGAHTAYSAQDLNDNGPLMTFDEICGLGEEIRHIWTDDAYRFMWIPPSIDAMPGVRDRVMDAWGFKCINYGFVWVKCAPKSAEGIFIKEQIDEEYALVGDDDEDHFGMGYYTRNAIEICYLGIKKDHKGRTRRMWHRKEGYKPNNIVRRPVARHPKGTPPRIAPDGKVIPRAGKPIHSRKPDEPQLRTTRWLGDQLEGAGMVELFATRRLDNYLCLGHALTNTDIQDDIERIWGVG